MKKRNIIGISCIVIFIVVLIVWIAGRSTKLLQDMDVSAIGKVEIYYPADNLTVVTGEEDIGKVVAVLQSVNVRKTFSDNNDGYAFDIRIFDKNGESIDWIVIRSDCIITNDGYYRCDRDYCDDFRKLYEDLQRGGKG